MAIPYTKTLTSEQKRKVLFLWNQEYPAQLRMETIEDFDQYLSGLTDASHILYTGEANHIPGWAFKFTRNKEKWFAIILDYRIHGQGIGSMLLNQLKENETELNGWVIDHDRYKKNNLETYVSPLSFYLKNGFVIVKDTRLESAHLSAAKILWNKA